MAVLLWITCLAAGCSKVDHEPIDNLRGGNIQVIGHAGLGFESMLTPYPSNSLISIRKLIEGYNADGAEIDVQLSQDSVPVLYHDTFLETMTDCYGVALDYPASSLLNCRYRTDFHSHILQDENLISLENVVQRYAGSVYNPSLYLDLKFPGGVGTADTAAYTGQAARAINRILATHNYAHQTIAEAGNIELLLALREVNPEVMLMIDNNNFQDALQLAQTYQLHGIVIANDHITKEQVKEAHTKGIQVAIFGVALRKDIVDAVNKHPDIIQTDNVILLQQILTQ